MQNVKYAMRQHGYHAVSACALSKFLCLAGIYNFKVGRMVYPYYLIVVLVVNLGLDLSLKTSPTNRKSAMLLL